MHICMSVAHVLTNSLDEMGLMDEPHFVVSIGQRWI